MKRHAQKVCQINLIVSDPSFKVNCPYYLNIIIITGIIITITITINLSIINSFIPNFYYLYYYHFCLFIFLPSSLYATRF